MAYSLTYSYNSTSQSYSVTGYSNITASDKVVIPATYDNGTNGSHQVTSIGNRAFQNCSSLTSVTIGNGVTSIGDYAFNGCSSLTSVTIPDSVTSIGSSAFIDCIRLEEITIPFVGAVAGKTANDTYQYPFGYIFGTISYTGGTAVKQDYYGSSMSSTTSTTYYIPSSLRKVTVTGGNILYGAFFGCSNLASITIPNSVTSIGPYAFKKCSSLTSITIPNSVTSIGKAAFSNCSSLTSVTIGNSVTSIGNDAFFGCSNLASITIPNSVTSISGYAFWGCSSLKSITIPNSVTSIGSTAFSNCSSLTSVTIPDSVTRIDSGAFSGCSNLASITIPNSVTSIGEGTFFGCSSLKQLILFPSTPPTLGSDAIPSTISKIYVQQSSKAAYQAATNWTTFASKIVSDNIYLSFVRFNQKNKEYIDGKISEFKFSVPTRSQVDLLF